MNDRYMVRCYMTYGGAQIRVSELGFRWYWTANLFSLFMHQMGRRFFTAVEAPEGAE